MDSDGHVSEEEEARLYSMLYYVDSSFNLTTAKESSPNETIENSQNNPDVQISDVIVNNVNNNTNNCQTDAVNESINTPVSLESSNQNSDAYEQEILISNDRTKRKITHHRRYWAGDTVNDVNTMYVRVHSKNAKKQSSKFDKAIITLLNTRASGKRKSSEGSYLPEDMNQGDVVLNTSTNNDKSTPLKQSKPTFATPKNTSTPTSAKKQNKSNKTIGNPIHVLLNINTRSNKNGNQFVSMNANKKQGKELTPLTRKLMDKFSKKTKKCKVNHTIRNSESIVIESSDDDDSVIEVELPEPKQTTIELDSSDESQLEDKGMDDENNQDNPSDMTTTTSQMNANKPDRTAISPVPSLVSSTSDDFIQADCSSLNITCGNNSGPVFNFKLHGSDFCDAQLDSNNSEISSSTNKPGAVPKKHNTVISSTARLLEVDPEINFHISPDNSQSNISHFATPTSQNRKKATPRIKNYSVSEETFALPSADVFESESSDIPESVIDVPITPISKKKRKIFSKEDSVDSTTRDIDSSNFQESELIMANVVGMEELNETNQEFDLCSEPETPDNSSQKQRKKKSKKKHQNLVKDMNEFYNTIYDKDFDHVKIKQSLPKNKDLWKVDPADKGKPRKTPVECGYCNKVGHRSESCFKKPQICFMCGATGHRNTRCPNKLCLKCGSPNNTFSVECNNCKSWKNLYCGTCREYGHPTAKCPDLWRRYHLTVKNEVPLVECRKRKSKSLLFCSGCAKRGHIINDCNNYIKFSNFKPSSPYIFYYTPVYTPDAVRNLSPLDSILIEDNDPNMINSQLKGNNESKQKKSVKELDSRPKTPTNLNKSKEIQVKECGDQPEDQDVTQKIQTNLNDNQQHKEANDKCKAQDSNVIKPNKESDDKISSTTSTLQATGDVLLPDKSAAKHLLITISSANSLNDSRSFVRDVKIVENVKEDCMVSDAPIADVADKQKEMNPSPDNNTGNKTPNETASSTKVASKINEINQLNEANTLLMPISKRQNSILKSRIGKWCLHNLMQSYNIVASVIKQGKKNMVKLTGNAEKHLDFQIDLQLCLYFDATMSYKTPSRSIPKDRSAALEMLHCEMDLLNKPLGNPKFILTSIEEEKNKLKQSGFITADPRLKEFHNSSRKVIKGYRLLNMILIGQKRLCGGREAFVKIQNMIKYLEELDSSTVDDKVRFEIGESYCLIFSSYPRSDYSELVDKYCAKTGTDFMNSVALQHLINKNKLSMERDDLIILFSKIIDVYQKFRNNPKTSSDKKFSNNLKQLLRLEPELHNKKFGKEKVQKYRKIAITFFNYLKTLNL